MSVEVPILQWHTCRDLVWSSGPNRMLASVCSDADRKWRVSVCVFAMELDMDGQLLSSAGEDSHHLFLSWCCHHNDQTEICSHWELLLQRSATHTHTHIKSTTVHTQTHKHILKTSQLLSKTIAMSPTHIVRSIYWSMLTFFQAIKNSSIWTLSYGIIGPL